MLLMATRLDRIIHRSPSRLGGGSVEIEAGAFGPARGKDSSTARDESNERRRQRLILRQMPPMIYLDSSLGKQHEETTAGSGCEGGAELGPG